MAKKPLFTPATRKQKKSFRKYLADDEELVLVTGYGTNLMRHHFALYIVFPGFIIWAGAVIGCYFILKQNGVEEADLWRLAVGYGLMVGLIFSMIFAYLKCILEYHSHRYLLTTRRVVIKKGYFAVRLTSALYDKITHLEVDQGLIDRAIMGHGRIIINTAGVHKDVLSLNYVDHPIQLKNIMEKLINRERELVGKSHRGEGLPIDGEFVKAK